MAVVIVACVPEEKVDLAGYPETQLGLNIGDIKTPSQNLTLTALYNNQGTLDIDGAVSHTYLIRLSEPNSQDMTFVIEPLLVNIPADKIVVSPSSFILKAGEIDLPVSVTCTDADFTFAALHKAAETYEIGLKVVDVKGYNVSRSIVGNEARVTINKEAYVSRYSLADGQGRTASFERKYWDGAILNATGMSYDFKAYLDKPADTDVKVTFTMDGLPAAFASTWSVTPAEVVIPAGSISSATATWTLSDNFLKTNANPEDYVLTLNSAIQTTDPTVVVAEGKSQITFNVAKKLDALELVPATVPVSIPAGWTKYASTGWVFTPTAASNVFDGSLTTFQSANNGTITISVDMLTAKALTGFIVRPYSNNATYNASSVEVFISDDGVTYTSIGSQTVTTRPTYYTLRLLGSITTRYLRFVTKYTGYQYISEIEIYY